ncbi:hypothetical protein V6N13_024931 [Hibiscus sabdariffa]
MEPILPHIFGRPTGRPYKKRKTETDEAPPMTGKVSKELRRPGTRTTPTTSQTPNSVPIEPAQLNVVRWIPTPTVRTTQESCVSHLSTNPSPIPTQPSHPNVFIWMSTPELPLSQENCGSQSSPRIDP